MKELKLNITYYKILETVYELNKMGYYPLPQGVFKIVSGKVDNETKRFINLPTFSTLISFGSKKICRLIMMLQRYNYLKKKYDPKTDEIYLETTQNAIDSITKYHKKHKNPYLKKEKNTNITIVKI